MRLDPAPVSGWGRGVRSTRTGARFHPLLPFEAWKELGASFGSYSSAMSWWLGDWLAFGQMKYGRRYKEAIAATGLDYQTLRNYAVVSRRFELSRRRDNLTFQHHAEVCALPDDEQERLLDRATAHRWSRNEFRRHLQQTARAASSALETLRLAVEEHHARHWREAANRSGCSFETWVVRALDQAAAAPICDRSSLTTRLHSVERGQV